MITIRERIFFEEAKRLLKENDNKLTKALIIQDGDYSVIIEIQLIKNDPGIKGMKFTSAMIDETI